MQIGLVIYGSLDTLSGGYLYDRKMVNHLRDAGDEVEIISLPWRNYAAHLMDNFSVSLLRRLSGARFDILIQDELNHPSLFRLNHRLRSKVDYSIISIVHHLRSSEKRARWQNNLYHLPERAYLKSVDGYIFNSRTTRSVVERAINETRPHVIAYPAGNRLDPQIAEMDIIARAKADRPLKITFLGSVIPRKNLHTLLDTISQLAPQSYRLSIIGGLDVAPNYVQKIHAQVKALKLTENVEFCGALSNGKLKYALRESHVLALPSSYEGFGIAYLEGMGYGLPAIGGKDGAAHEIITHKKDGFLIQTNDANTLATHLRELANDREKLIQMSLAARQRYLAHPTWDESAAKIREFLCELTRISSAT